MITSGDHVQIPCFIDLEIGEKPVDHFIDEEQWAVILGVLCGCVNYILAIPLLDGESTLPQSVSARNETRQLGREWLCWNKELVRRN